MPDYMVDIPKSSVQLQANLPAYPKKANSSVPGPEAAANRNPRGLRREREEVGGERAVARQLQFGGISQSTRTGQEHPMDDLRQPSRSG